MTLKTSNKNKYVLILKIIGVVLLLASSGLLIVTLIGSSIIPLNYLLIVISLIVIADTLAIFLLFKSLGRFTPWARGIATALIVIISALSILGFYMINSGLSTLDKITSGGESVDIETDKSFNIFISGIDSYGDISTVSRSDVNIVATVNPDTRQIRLTTVPRDSYVAIALGGNNQMDKLTHAGNYGVESSMKTVANLLDTDIDNYLRINFSSFISGVDKVGGVTVNNPRAFKAVSGEYFNAGKIQLNGKQALAFSRERKSLEGGDVARGGNQQLVIQGFINRITQMRTPGEFNSLLEVLGESFDTNISSKSLRALINEQVATGGQWTTTSAVLEGKGQTGGLPSYAMPGSQLYMYVLDEASVSAAKADIQRTLSAK